MSNPTWDETPRGEILVSVECAADPFRPTTLRLVWILEGSDGGQLEARIFGGIPESGMLHGTIRRNFGRPLRPPVSTYLAEARAGLDEPRRVSNILTVAETSP